MKLNGPGWAFLITLGILQSGLAEELTLPAVTPAKFAEAPKLDGQLDDACWKTAAKIELNHLLGSTSAPAVKTEAWLGYDDQWLYVGVQCEDEKGKVIKAAQQGYRNPAAGQDDSIELFLNASGGKYNYYQFILGAGKAQWEQRVTGPDAHHRDKDWSVTWRSAAQVGKKGWSAEAALPLFILGDKHPRAVIPFNMVRTKQTDPQAFITWAPVGGTRGGLGYHDPEHFGVLKGLEGVTIARVFDPVILKAEVASPYREKAGRFQYDVKVTVGNQAGRPGESLLLVKDCAADGRIVVATNTVKAPPVGKETFVFSVPVAAPVDRSASVALEAQQADPHRWLAVTGTNQLITLMAYPNLSYYSGEPEGRLVVGTAYSDEEFRRQELQLRLEVRDAKQKKMLQETCRETTAQGMVQPFPAGQWQPGIYGVRVELQDRKGRVLAAVDQRIRVEAPPPPGICVSKIDHEAMCLLVNGKPFFPVGFLCAGVNDTNCLARMAQGGCNAVVDWIDWGMYRAHAGTATWTTNNDAYLAKSIATNDPAYRLAARYNLPVFATSVGTVGLGWNGEGNRPELKAVLDHLPLVVNAWKTNPGLVAWKGVDESDNTCYDLACAYTAVIRKLDPYHVTWCSSRGVGPLYASGDAFDFMGFHGYYSPEEGPRRLAWLVQSAYQTLKIGRMPVTATPQGQRLTYDRELTPDERRCGIFLALINGAKGVLYFSLENYGPYNETLWRVLKYTAREMEILAPMLLKDRPPQIVDVNETTAANPPPPALPPLPPRRRHYDPSMAGQFGWGGAIPLPLVQALIQDKIGPEPGELILIANSGKDPVTVNCVLSSLSAIIPSPLKGEGSGKLREYFSGKEIAVKDGRFTIEFEPYGVRVLETVGSSRRTDDPVSMGITVVKPEPVAVQGENLVANGGFEEPLDIVKTNKYGTSCQLYGNWELSGDAVLVTNDVHAGARALRLAGNTNGHSCTAYRIPFQPNTKYRISLWSKREIRSGKNQPGMTIMLPPDTFTGNPAFCGPADQPGWQRFASTFTTKDQAVTGSVYILVAIGSDATLWVDDVRVESMNALRQKMKAEGAAAAGTAIYGKADDIEQMTADAPPEPGENIIKNSSFEEYTLAGLPDHWAGHGYSKSFVGVESAESYDGRYCLLLPISYYGKWGGDYHFFSNWQFGRTYTLSAYVKAEKPGGKINVMVHPYEGAAKTSLLQQEFNVGTNWARVTFSFSPVKEGPGRWAGPAVLCFGNHGAAEWNVPFKIWVDAVQLELGGQATPYQRDSYQAPKIDAKWRSDDIFKELERQK